MRTAIPFVFLGSRSVVALVILWALVVWFVFGLDAEFLYASDYRSGHAVEYRRSFGDKGGLVFCDDDCERVDRASEEGSHEPYEQAGDVPYDFAHAPWRVTRSGDRTMAEQLKSEPALSSRWPLRDSVRLGLLGVTGIKFHSVKDKTHRTGQFPTPILGPSLSLCISDVALIAGHATNIDLRLQVFANSDPTLLVHFPLHAATPVSYMLGSSLGIRAGTDSLFGSISITLQHDWIWYKFSDSSFMANSLQMHVALGTWYEHGSFVEVGPTFSLLLNYPGSWAIGGEFVLGIGDERLRILFLTQFERRNAIGPHPYILVTYEWRIL